MPASSATAATVAPPSGVHSAILPDGLYKVELIHRRVPWKTKEAVEFATLEWVSWFNHHRLLEPIGYIPPAEAGKLLPATRHSGHCGGGLT